MSISTFPYPAQLKEQLETSLRAALGIGRYDTGLHVWAERHDERGRKAPTAAKTAYYEVGVFHNGGSATTAADPFLLDSIESAVRALPGVYRTTRVNPDDHGYPAGIDDQDWPVYRSRGDRDGLRVQVLALMCDAGRG